MSYSVDLARLEQVTERLTRFVDRCDEHLTHVEALIDSTPIRWEGDEARVYAERHREWVASARSMNEHAAAVRDRVATARAAYEEALAANLRMFG